jgi:hypothetical protein
MSQTENVSTQPSPKSLDKEKYYRIMEFEGLNAALTALHQDMWSIEFDCFEGQKGYQPQVFEDLKAYRQFSLDLWDKKFDPKVKQ